MALEMSLTVLLGAPVRMADIGNVAMLAMLGQGGGWAGMETSGGPGIVGDCNSSCRTAGNPVGRAVAVCTTESAEANPPCGIQKKLSPGGGSIPSGMGGGHRYGVWWGGGSCSDCDRVGGTGTDAVGDSNSNDGVVAMHTTAGVEMSPPPDRPEISSSGRCGKGSIMGRASASESSKGRNTGREEGGVLSVGFQPAGISIGNWMAMVGGDSDKVTRAKGVGGSNWCTGSGEIAVTSAGGGTDEAAEDIDMEAGRGNADPSAAGPGKCSRSVTTVDGKQAPMGDANRVQGCSSIAGEGSGRSWHVGLGATSRGVEAAAADMGEGNDTGGGSASTPSAGGWPTGDGIGDIAESSDGKSSRHEVLGMGGATADSRGSDTAWLGGRNGPTTSMACETN